ncbi:MAG: radical SAM protein [Terricaulis sp.]
MRGYLRLDLADNCNIRCVMCQAYNDLPVARMKFMDFDNFVTRTRGQLGEWSIIQLGNVAEPTVHPKFLDFLRYIRAESDATIHIVTNGKLLHRHADVINQTGGCLVQVSMDSVHKRTHEYIRKGSSYDRLVNNLDMLDRARTQVLLSFTLMNSNIDEYDDMIEFCRARNFQMSAFPMILRDEHGVLPLSLMKESLWFNRTALHSWVQRHYGSDHGDIVFGAAPGTSNGGIDAFTCDAHVKDLTIDSVGTTVICGKVMLGSLEDQNLDTLWLSAEANEFRRQVDDDRAPCMTCDYRQRCIAPSMTLLENHFTSQINLVLSAETKQAIGYNRNISDEEAASRFIEDVSDDLGVFDIQERADGTFCARRMGTTTNAPELVANTRHELQAAMVAEVVSRYDIVLVEGSFLGHNLVRYLGKYWGIPESLGRVNISREADRERPGVLVRDSMEELRLAIESVPAFECELPQLLHTQPPYNIVAYRSEFWALPLALGPVDLVQEARQPREGVIVAQTLDELRTRLALA